MKPRPEFAAQIDAMERGGPVRVVTVPQLFPTPRDVAERMADLADIQAGHRVLEPSAGTGNLLEAITTAARRFEADIYCGAVEISAILVDSLCARFPRWAIKRADFLQMESGVNYFDRIVMNPPFENGADIRHIEHAMTFLRPGGRLVGICANGPRQIARLKPITSLWDELPAGTFQGTQVRAALLVIEKSP